RTSAWCAWIDPDCTLFGPAVRASGICLERLLVVRPQASEMARIAWKLAESGIFSVVVVDVSSVPSDSRSDSRYPSLGPWAKIARRLSLAVEKNATTLFLLTDADAPRPSQLPVAMRVELERKKGAVSVRVAKERYGRVSAAKSIVWT